MLISENHLNLIRKLAWSFHNTTGIDWQELFSEASLAYCKALQNYNSKKGRCSIYLWGYIRSSLLNFVKKERKYQSPLIPINGTEYTTSNYNPFEYVPIIYFYRQNGDMKKVIHEALKNKKVIQKELKTKYKWSDFVIEQAVTDLKILMIHNN